ncbi:myosin regulatory light chain 2 [Sitodiplosis mosellana]|uniref:myosin regulatory light chain 2 n=1 Tax=Sitodiplosis mosellana TaxID=263140 RepID=UPI00244522A4|nr:myosin regulatory light chain 2 [Sitodiplosis mosellana]
MSEKEKKVKKKKTKEGDSTTEATPEETPAATPASTAATPKSPSGSTRQSSKSGGSSSRRAKRAGSNVFSMFSQKQVAEFKEAFQLMDQDKDGIIGKNDLRTTFDAVGRLTNDKELEEMLGEASGPINFTQLLTLFAKRMAGSGATDDDDVVIDAFKKFDENGVIDGDKLRHLLTSFGERFSQTEVDDAYDQMIIDDKNMIDTAALIEMLTGKEEGEEEEAA